VIGDLVTGVVVSETGPARAVIDDLVMGMAMSGLTPTPAWPHWHVRHPLLLLLTDKIPGHRPQARRH